MMGNGFGMGFGGGFMWLLWILGIVAVVWVVIAAARSRSSPQSPKSALDILKERYARGEIDQEEFEQKRKSLEG